MPCLNLRSIIIDFNFATPEEISKELGVRLKRERLVQGLTQAELAARAGVARGAVMHLENEGTSTLPTLVRVVQALGLDSTLQQLFVREVVSISELEKVEAGRQRVRHRNSEQPEPA